MTIVSHHPPGQTLLAIAAALLTAASAARAEVPGLPATATPADRAIAALLHADLSAGQSRLEAVRGLYTQARTAAPNDPRLEYAYSLVLQRLFQSTEARRHLDLALTLNPRFAPANQAVIRELLKARQFVDAGERLTGFANRLAADDPSAPDSAEWVGRIVSAVILAIGTPDAQQLFAYHDRMLRTSLPPVLLIRYEVGFANVQRELELLTDSIGEARSTAESSRELAKARIDADLVKDQQEIKKRQQDAEKSRQKWDEWIVDQTAKADDLLAEQEKRFRELENAATVQLQSVTALRLTLNRIDSGLLQPQRPPSGINSGLIPVAFATPNRDAVELQLAIEERRLAALYDQQAAIARAASNTVATRRNAVAQYQQATGVVLNEAASLSRWEKRNASIAANMKKSAEKKPALVATLEARIRSLNTWDPADFESERQRLLSDLGLEPNSQ